MAKNAESETGGIRPNASDVSHTVSHRRSILAMTDPMPPPEVTQLWRTAAQAATIGIFVILLIGALYFGRPILLPTTSAFVVTMMLGPLSARAERLGVPTLVTAIVLAF
jgi:hypothetical protein